MTPGYVPLDHPTTLRDLTDTRVREEIRNQAIADARKTIDRRKEGRRDAERQAPVHDIPH